MRAKIEILAAAIALAALLLTTLARDPPERPAPAAQTAVQGAPSRSAELAELAERRPLPRRWSGARRPDLPSGGGGDANEAPGEAEPEARRMTPHKLYASRAGGRMTLLAIQARQLGEPALADAAEALGNELWASAGRGRTDHDVAALLPRQAELVAKLKDLARRHADPFLVMLVGEVDDDLTAVQRGEPRGVERKLEAEGEELPRGDEREDG